MNDLPRELRQLADALGGRMHVSYKNSMRKAAAEILSLRVQLEIMTRDRDAYAKAKRENDDRFMSERDEAREQLATEKALRKELEFQLMGRDGDVAAAVEIMNTAKEALQNTERELAMRMTQIDKLKERLAEP
jgi:hypothetical protein